MISKTNMQWRQVQARSISDAINAPDAAEEFLRQRAEAFDALSPEEKAKRAVAAKELVAKVKALIPKE